MPALSYQAYSKPISLFCLSIDYAYVDYRPCLPLLLVVHYYQRILLTRLPRSGEMLEMPPHTLHQVFCLLCGQANSNKSHAVCIPVTSACQENTQTTAAGPEVNILSFWRFRPGCQKLNSMVSRDPIFWMAKRSTHTVCRVWGCVSLVEFGLGLVRGEKCFRRSRNFDQLSTSVQKHVGERPRLPGTDGVYVFAFFHAPFSVASFFHSSTPSALRE